MNSPKNLGSLTLVLFSLALVTGHSLAGLQITASPRLPRELTNATPRPGATVMIRNLHSDPGGTTSLRFVSHRIVDTNKYLPRSVTVFGRYAAIQPQRDRDLGQTFRTQDVPFRMRHLTLRVGPSERAVLAGALGARVALQWFEVEGSPYLDDHGTHGALGRFDRAEAPELDDFLVGETLLPIHVTEGRLPSRIAANDYLQFVLTGKDAIWLQPNRGYGFLLMFRDQAPDRSLALANEYFGRYRPDPGNPWVGHGIRREGMPGFPERWRARLVQPPGTLGFPDVCTHRDLWFAVTAGEVGPAHPGRWVREIQAFDEFDRAHPPPRNAVLFVGSSSIRLWKRLAEDLPEHSVIQRGFGGSHMSDLLAWSDRLILRYQPKVIFVYEGDNDLAAGRSPRDIAREFAALARRVQRVLPQTHLAYIAVKPSPAREALMPLATEVNRSIERLCRNHRRLGFVDVFAPMIGPDGHPRPELFLKDQLHLNDEGYALWAARVREHLAKVPGQGPEGP
jgi:lysophospholipase L1-like esterase